MTAGTMESTHHLYKPISEGRVRGEGEWRDLEDIMTCRGGTCLSISIGVLTSGGI